MLCSLCFGVKMNVAHELAIKLKTANSLNIFFDVNPMSKDHCIAVCSLTDAILMLSMVTIFCSFQGFKLLQFVKKLNP